jgi:D-methionine transport system substrate-binding protein
MKRKLICLGIALVMIFGLFAGCGSKEEVPEETEAGKEDAAEEGNGEKTIKIGCMSSSEPIVQIIADGMKEKGYAVEAVLFDQNNMPCTALKDGEIDGVILNHKPWLETFCKENNCELTMAEPYIYYSPFRLYSEKYDDVKDFPDGAAIAVPSDAANMERSLLVLQEVGLIKLGEKAETFYSIVDIEENPKNIQFVEAEITTAARSIHDADAVISPAVYIFQDGGVDVEDYLFDDPASEVKYPLGLIVESGEEGEDWVKEAIACVFSENGKKAFDEEYHGTYILIEQ